MDGPGPILILSVTHVGHFAPPPPPPLPQANYGGMRVQLPPSLKSIYNDNENSATQSEEVGVVSTPNEVEQEVEMNWNICNYLPESSSCQDIFRVLIAGHIHALYTHEVESRRNHTPGSTPIQRRHTHCTQTQVRALCWCPSHSLHPSPFLSLTPPMFLPLSPSSPLPPPLLSPSPSSHQTTL